MILDSPHIVETSFPEAKIFTLKGVKTMPSTDPPPTAELIRLLIVLRTELAQLVSTFFSTSEARGVNARKVINKLIRPRVPIRA